jgi:hypothetical protein
MTLIIILGVTATLAIAALLFDLYARSRALKRRQKRAHEAHLKLERELREELFSLREALFAPSLIPDEGTTVEDMRRAATAGRLFSEGVASIMGYSFDGKREETK